MMKNFTLLTLFSFFVFTSFAQAPPEAINYSGVARDNSGLPLANTAIGLQLSILETSSTGNAIYEEAHSTITDDYGRFDVALGMGTPTSGTFSTIDWGGDSHFLSVGMDVNGGTSYQAMGTTQMLSVPYALYAKEAGSVNGLGDITISQMGDTLFNGTDTLIIPGISSANGGNSYYTPGGGVTDIDGNNYTTIVMVNGQEWMAENLRTTNYANGDPIPNVTADQHWENLTTGAWCWFDNDASYELTSGKLYNWYCADDSRNVCPTGWHAPDIHDMNMLVDLLGGEYEAGVKLKMDDPLWYSPNRANNESGFAALPGGKRSDQGTFYWATSLATFIGSGSYPTVNGTGTFYPIMSVSANSSAVNAGNQSPFEGMSIRCIKD